MNGRFVRCSRTSFGQISTIHVVFILDLYSLLIRVDMYSTDGFPAEAIPADMFA